VNRLLALWRTAIGKKVVMALTGLIGLAFLVSHVISNLLVFTDPHHLDEWGAFLRSLGPALWLARAVLLGAVVLHIVAAWQLTRQARAARPGGYARHETQVATYAARTMRWGGVLLAVFIVFHILHLTLGQFHPDFREGQVGRNLVTGLAVTPVALFYALAMLSLGAHFAHGVWSVFQTLGLNHPAWNRARIALAVGSAVLIAGGFLAIPLAALLGVLR
jgi:succinate dehydrogenase / fumarate reductase cytochrome b subunit